MIWKLVIDTANSHESAVQVCIELHSHIGRVSPFCSTGFTGFYKETGYYPDPVKVTNSNVLKITGEMIENFENQLVVLLLLKMELFLMNI